MVIIVQSIFSFVCTGVGSCWHICHCTLEDYIVDNDINHRRFANMLSIPVVFHVDFRPLMAFLSELIPQPQCLGSLPCVYLPFQSTQQLDKDNSWSHPCVYEVLTFSLLQFVTILIVVFTFIKAIMA